MEAGAATEGASSSADEETSHPSRGKEAGPSLNSLALMRKATSAADIKDWRCAAYEGVLLKKSTLAKSHHPLNSICLSFSANCKMCGQKFWVDEKLHKNCFRVLPMACDIAGADEESCWTWTTTEEKCFPMAVNIDVPKSKDLNWFSIRGRFKTRVLSPNTMYGVAFEVKLNGANSMPCFDANLELDLPDGTQQTHQEQLSQKAKEEWRKVHAGEFMMGPKTVGTIYFGLYGCFNTPQSSPATANLMLKGVLIHPKDEAKQSYSSQG